MNWYSAHIVMFVEFKQGRQQTYPVWENVVLISARSCDEAFKKAEGHGRAAEGDDDGSFSWQERPARWVFAGIRKLTECQDSAHRPVDGTELSYNELRLHSREAIQRLANGKPTEVLMCDQFAADDPVEDETMTARRTKRPA